MREGGRVLRQALALGALSVLLAAAVHFPLIGRFLRGEFRETFFQAAEHSGLRMITFEEAEDLWRTAAAVFLDARTSALFGQGHVPGARSLPASAPGKELAAAVAGQPRERTTVVYCEGGDCQSSLVLAERLIDEGFRDVRVFSGGWAAWTAAGLPQERTETREKGERGDGQE